MSQREVRVDTQSSVSRAGGRGFKSILLEPFKQIKFGIYVLAVSLVFLIAEGVLFVMAFKEQYQNVMSIFNVVNPDTQWELVTDDVFYKNAALLAGLFVVYLGVMFFLIFRLTHRYYGPLVSIGRFVGEMKEGNYGARVTIRKGDELQELVHSLNEMAEKLEKRHGGKDAKPAGAAQTSVAASTTASATSESKPQQPA